jgi:hypothetical protein
VVAAGWRTVRCRRSTATHPGLAIPPLLTPMFETAFVLLVAALLLVII